MITDVMKRVLKANDTTIESVLEKIDTRQYVMGLGKKASKDFLAYRKATAETVVVTRHKDLIILLQELGLVKDGVRIIAHVTQDEIHNKHVIGVLPLSLACHALSVTEVALNIPQEYRGVELTLEQLRDFYVGIHTYKVNKLPG